MVHVLMSRPCPDALERKQSDIVLHDLANAGCNGAKMHRLKSIAAIAGVLALLSLAPAYSQDQPTAAGISDEKLDQAAARTTLPFAISSFSG